MEGLSTIVKAKSTANKAAIKLRLNEVEREKLEQYQKQDKLNAKEAKLKKDFLAMDADGDGTISTDEMAKVLRAMKTKLRMSESEIKRTLREFDMDGDGEIEVSEFLYMMGNSKKRDLIHRAIVQHSAIHNEFRQFDTDGNGKITQDEFAKVYESRTGLKPGKEQFASILRSVDINGDGMIGYDEFLTLMLNIAYKPVI